MDAHSEIGHRADRLPEALPAELELARVRGHVRLEDPGRRVAVEDLPQFDRECLEPRANLAHRGRPERERRSLPPDRVAGAVEVAALERDPASVLEHHRRLTAPAHVEKRPAADRKHRGEERRPTRILEHADSGHRLLDRPFHAAPTLVREVTADHRPPHRGHRTYPLVAGGASAR